VDADMPDSAIGIIRAIAAAAGRVAASGGTGMAGGPAGPDALDLRIVEILAAEPFTEQAGAEKLVRDALHD
jgi:hypothetical protein